MITRRARDLKAGDELVGPEGISMWVTDIAMHGKQMEIGVTDGNIPLTRLTGPDEGIKLAAPHPAGGPDGLEASL